MSEVLLIDDEEPIRKILGLFLRSKGYEVVTAADGQRGIELFQRQRQPIVLTRNLEKGRPLRFVYLINHKEDKHKHMMILAG